MTDLMGRIIASRLTKSVLASGTLLAALPASAADEDVGLWNAQFVRFDVDKKNNVFVRLESQQRFNEDVGRIGQFVGRVLVAYRFNPQVNLGAGYAYVQTTSNATPEGFTYEHRTYQELGYRVLNKPGLRIDTMSRLEQRQWTNLPDFSHRARMMVQVHAPLGKNGLGPVISVEPFFNLNDQPSHPGGFDQIRTFGGVFIPVNRKADVIVGYLNLYQPREGREDRMDHIIWLRTFVRL